MAKGDLFKHLSYVTGLIVILISQAFVYGQLSQKVEHNSCENQRLKTAVTQLTKELNSTNCLLSEIKGYLKKK